MKKFWYNIKHMGLSKRIGKNAHLFVSILYFFLSLLLFAIALIFHNTPSTANYRRSEIFGLFGLGCLSIGITLVLYWDLRSSTDFFIDWFNKKFSPWVYNAIKEKAKIDVTVDKTLLDKQISEEVSKRIPNLDTLFKQQDHFIGVVKFLLASTLALVICAISIIFSRFLN